MSTKVLYADGSEGNTDLYSGPRYRSRRYSRSAYFPSIISAETIAPSSLASWWIVGYDEMSVGATKQSFRQLPYPCLDPSRLPEGFSFELEGNLLLAGLAKVRVPYSVVLKLAPDSLEDSKGTLYLANGLVVDENGDCRLDPAAVDRYRTIRSRRDARVTSGTAREPWPKLHVLFVDRVVCLLRRCESAADAALAKQPWHSFTRISVSTQLSTERGYGYHIPAEMIVQLEHALKWFGRVAPGWLKKFSSGTGLTWLKTHKEELYKRVFIKYPESDREAMNLLFGHIIPTLSRWEKRNQNKEAVCRK